MASRYRRVGKSPSNPGIILLEGEDGRIVPVTAELADSLAPEIMAQEGEPLRPAYDAAPGQRPIPGAERRQANAEAGFAPDAFDLSEEQMAREGEAIMARPSMVTPADVAGYARQPQAPFQGEQRLPQVVDPPVMQEARLGGPRASAPLAQDGPRRIQLGEVQVQGRDFPTQEVDAANAALAQAGMPNPNAVVPGAPPGMNTISGVPTATGSEQFMMADEPAPAGGTQSSTMQVPGLEGVIGQTGTQVPGVGPISPPAMAPSGAPGLPTPPAGQAQTPPASNAAMRMATPLEVANMDLNGNRVPDIFEQRGGGAGAGNRIVTSRTVQAPISPGTMDELSYRTNVRRDAERALGDTVSQGLAGLTDIERQTQQRLQAHDAEAQRELDSAVVKLRDMNQRRQEAAQRLMSGRVDPDRYLGSRGSAGRVGAAISMTMNTLAGIYAGRDLGPTLIMREIDRDIAAQETNLDQAAREFQAGGQLLQEMRQSYQDDQAARLAARSVMIEDALRRLRIATMSNANAEARQRGMVIEAQLQQELALTQARLEQQAWSATITQTQRLGGGGRRGPMVTPEGLNAYRGAYTATVGENGSNPPPYGASFLDTQGPGSGERVWNSLNAERRGNVIEMLGRSDTMISGLQELRDLTANGSRLSPDDRGRAHSLIGELELAIAVMQEQGALQAPDAERVRRQLTNFTSYDPREMVGALSAIETTLRRSQARAHLIAQRYGINPNGARTNANAPEQEE